MRLVVLVACASMAASGAPMLRLSNSVVGPVTVAAGAPAPPQTVEAYNIGDGALALGVSVEKSATWLAASVGAARACSDTTLPAPCVPLQFQFNTAALGQRTYTAQVTVSDPRAIDAPQVVMVTVHVGTPDPVSVDRYLAPGMSYDTAVFPGDGALCLTTRGGCPAVSASTQDGGTWLSIVVYQPGTIRFYSSYMIHLAPPLGMQEGVYHGSVAVSGSPPDRVIPVTMRVTTQPIAAPTPAEIDVRLAEGGPAMTYPFLPYVALANTGLGTLTVQDVSASGPGVSAYNDSGVAIVTADPGALPAGTGIDGAVTMQCNAVNCPVQVPARIEIASRGAPVIQYRGVVDNVSFLPGSNVTPGDVVVAKGEQLSLRAPEFGGVPLATSLGGASVLVNDVYAPMYYSSSGQVAFRIPSATALGTARVQVVRDGLAGNTVSVNVAARAPRILAVTDANYNRIDLQHPAKAGDPLVIWAIGLGPTTPAVADGTLPDGLASLTVTPIVQWVGMVSRNVTPAFAGLSGGAVGVYQVNVTLPQDLPPGSELVALRFPDVLSEAVTIAVK